MRRGERVPLHSFGCPRIHYIDYTDLKFTNTCLLLSDIKGMCHHAQHPTPNYVFWTSLYLTFFICLFFISVTLHQKMVLCIYMIINPLVYVFLIRFIADVKKTH